MPQSKVSVGNPREGAWWKITRNPSTKKKRKHYYQTTSKEANEAYNCSYIVSQQLNNQNSLGLVRKLLKNAKSVTVDIKSDVVHVRHTEMYE